MGAEEGKEREQLGGPCLHAECGCKGLECLDCADHKGMPKGGPVMERAKGDEKFRISRDAPRGFKENCAVFTEREVVALRMPYIFVDEAVWKECCPGLQGDRGVVCRDDKAVSDVQAIHIKGRGGERGAAKIPVLESVDPPGVAAQQCERGAAQKRGVKEETIFPRDSP